VMSSERGPGENSREVVIESLGLRGDGVAHLNGEQIFIPFSVPGDHLRISVDHRGKFTRIIEHTAHGPAQKKPVCEHFGQCGGCSVQHIIDATYKRWKENILIGALARRGINTADVMPMVAISPGSRRRARLHFIQTNNGLVLGFKSARSDQVVGVNSCPLITNAMRALISPIGLALSGFSGNGVCGEVSLTETNTGVDLLFALQTEPSLSLREKLSRFAHDHNVARISLKGFDKYFDQDPEPVVIRRTPEIDFSGLKVKLPMDGFVQPTKDGETLLRRKLLDFIKSTDRVVDLFAGSGAFSLPIARYCLSVHAVDMSARQIRALEESAKEHGLSTRVSAEIRNLDQRPLLENELKAFTFAILDPPRIGAFSQVQRLAKSDVPTIAYISCNPVSFAKDAEVLTKAGYSPLNIMPIDQFLWSHHLELIAIFVKQ
jgi:23S rRNA (uracil1939-C5)-methyltransferase